MDSSAANSQSHPKHLDKKFLEDVIKNLRPKSEVYTGITFLKKLLDSKGPEGVLDFVKRASVALDEEGSLDLAFNFNDVEREIFKESRPNMSRRNFLHTIGYAVPGAVFGAYGAASLGNRAIKKITGEKSDDTPPTSRRNFLGLVKDVTGEIPMDIANLFIGAALINEGYEKWVEIKLEQIADAVSLLDERIKTESKSSSSPGR
ncbi:MAG: hypothetical protein SFW63_09000 [Alphaproteobacteria bacterium]|nr:hypothetical protein [Alphaproteobacteria bacterium]